MKKFLQVLSLGLIIFTCASAQAEDKPTRVSKKPPAERSQFTKDVEAFTKDFDEMEKRHFVMLISNYNLTKVVQTVEGDITLAVTKCGEANPDMKAKLDSRAGEWSTAIAPVMKEAESNVENMILAQDYAKPKDIRGFFKKIDEQREAKDKEVEKVPVTSKDACEHLYKTMGKTEEKMVKLLRSTLVSLPQVTQAEMEKKKAEEEAGAKAAGEAAKVKEEADKAAAEKAPEPDKPAEDATPAEEAKPAEEPVAQ